MKWFQQLLRLLPLLISILFVVSATATFIHADVDRVTPADCAEYYIVHSGDVLGSIAQDVNVSVEQLVQRNNLLTANVVFPGQLLCITRK